MRVLYITNDFLDEIGGISRHLEELSRRLALDAEVTIAYLSLRGRDQEVQLSGNRRVIAIPHAGSAYQRWRTFPLARLKALCTAIQPDIVHVHSPLEALRYAGHQPCPLIYTQHSSVLSRWLRTPGLRGFALKRLSQFDRVIAVSGSVANGLRPLGCEIIPNGIASYGDLLSLQQRRLARAELLERFGWSEDERPLVVSVGRLVPHKGVADFLVANRHLLNAKKAAFRLIIVGDGPQLSALQQLVREMPTVDVGFAGAMAGDKLAGFYNAADLCIVPSRSETFGMVALEAMAMGAIPVVRAVDGLLENVVDGVTGFHLPSTLSIEPILDRFANANVPAMQQAGSEYVRRHYDWTSVAARTLAIYKTVIHPQRQAPSSLSDKKVQYA